ncbi:MAG TPA: STAS/SEC14 domain-containing protein [Myxococcales bacterium]|nr:STAS/SEC14 domain-containing protein [Myxococcales bacterium]
MPVSVTFSPPSTFVLRSSGKVSLEDGRGALEEVRNDLRLREGAALLNEAVDVSEVPSIAELCVLAADLVPLVRHGLRRIAVVVPEKLVGVARTFAAFAWVMNANVRVFSRLADAQRWLAPQ